MPTADCAPDSSPFTSDKWTTVQFSPAGPQAPGWISALIFTPPRYASSISAGMHLSEENYRSRQRPKVEQWNRVKVKGSRRTYATASVRGPLKTKSASSERPWEGFPTTRVGWFCGQYCGVLGLRSMTYSAVTAASTQGR